MMRDCHNNNGTVLYSVNEAEGKSMQQQPSKVWSEFLANLWIPAQFVDRVLNVVKELTSKTI